MYLRRRQEDAGAPWASLARRRYDLKKCFPKDQMTQPFVKRARREWQASNAAIVPMV